jgi:hypothetical protein
MEASCVISEKRYILTEKKKIIFGNFAKTLLVEKNNMHKRIFERFS